MSKSSLGADSCLPKEHWPDTIQCWVVGFILLIEFVLVFLEFYSFTVSFGVELILAMKKLCLQIWWCDVYGLFEISVQLLLVFSIAWLVVAFWDFGFDTLFCSSSIRWAEWERNSVGTGLGEDILLSLTRVRNISNLLRGRGKCPNVTASQQTVYRVTDIP